METMQTTDDFKADLCTLINIHSKENDSNTPDFILAGFLVQCLEALTGATEAREAWYRVKLAPGLVGSSILERVEP
jgi:hypothetical protein